MKIYHIVIFQTLLCLCLSSSSVNAAPSWFQNALKACKADIHEDLVYEYKRYYSGARCKKMQCFDFVNITARDSLIVGALVPPNTNDYIITPSTSQKGKCCAFDGEGHIITSQLVSGGIDECTKIGGNNHQISVFGLWWPAYGYYMDWWYKAK